MRIALLSLHFSEYACRLAAALTSDHEVLLLVSDRNASEELTADELARFAALPGLRLEVIQHTRSPLKMIANVRAIVAAVDDFRPDVLHLQEDTKDYLVAAVTVLRRRYPFVMTVHDPAPHSGEDARQINFSRHSVYRWWLRRLPDQVITHGAQLNAEMLRLAPRLRGRLTATAIGPYGPAAAPPPAPDGSLLFFGRINEYKGLSYFLDAVLLLRARGLDVRGVIAGRGSDLARNRPVILANSCFELHDEFIARDKVGQLFSQARLLVMPYLDATQSGVAAMALGFGRPVVATNVGAIPEMVLHGRTGLIVPPRDVGALADAIEGLLRDPARLEAMNLALREYGAGRWAEIARMTGDIYIRAVGGT